MPIAETDHAVDHDIGLGGQAGQPGLQRGGRIGGQVGEWQMGAVP